MNFEDFKDSNEKDEAFIGKDYLEYIIHHGKEKFTEELLEIRKNVIPLKFIPCNDEDIPVGASKSGGYPDLPPSISIPVLSGYTRIDNSDGSAERYEASAMQLVAQFNLSEMAKYDIDGKLPKYGMLYIFWSGEILIENNRFCTYKIEGEHQDLFRIFYYDGDISLLKRTKPDIPYYSKYFEKVFDSYVVEPQQSRFMYHSSKLEDILWDEEEEDEELYTKLCEDYEKWEVGGNKLLGYPSGCVNIGNPRDGDANLFQFDYDEGAIFGICWFISEKDLEDKNFTRVTMRVDFS